MQQRNSAGILPMKNIVFDLLQNDATGADAVASLTSGPFHRENVVCCVVASFSRLGAAKLETFAHLPALGSIEIYLT